MADLVSSTKVDENVETVTVLEASYKKPQYSPPRPYVSTVALVTVDAL